MVVRIPFPLVQIQVDRLFTQAISTSDWTLETVHHPEKQAEAEEISDYIRTFIESCGWVVEDFIVEMMGGKDLKVN